MHVKINLYRMAADFSRGHGEPPGDDLVQIGEVLLDHSCGLINHRLPIRTVHRLQKGDDLVLHQHRFEAL